MYIYMSSYMYLITAARAAGVAWQRRRRAPARNRAYARAPRAARANLDTAAGAWRNRRQQRRFLGGWPPALAPRARIAARALFSRAHAAAVMASRARRRRGKGIEEGGAASAEQAEDGRSRRCAGAQHRGEKRGAAGGAPALFFGGGGRGRGACAPARRRRLAAVSPCLPISHGGHLRPFRALPVQRGMPPRAAAAPSPRTTAHDGGGGGE